MNMNIIVCWKSKLVSLCGVGSIIGEKDRIIMKICLGKVIDFGICFNRRSSNMQKGGQGLVGILVRTLTNISLDILVSHGLDITYHLHRAVSSSLQLFSIVDQTIPFCSLI